MPQRVTRSPTCWMGWSFLLRVTLFLLTMTTSVIGQSEPALRMRLDLDIGGSVEGAVLDHTDALILIQYRGAPWALAFDELTVASAYQAKKQLRIRLRGGPDRLTARDHFDLGTFALARQHRVLANKEFRLAQKMDPGLAEAVQQVQREHRDDPSPQDNRPAADSNPPVSTAPTPLSDPLPVWHRFSTGESLTGDQREQIIAAYKKFGRSVQRQLNSDLELIETDHFLIWTDWSRRKRESLARWCEDMYRAVAVQFGLDDSREVFLGKCPVFCFRSKARFLRFARTYDDWKPTSAVGYTRTDPGGYVHLVIYRRRPSPFEVRRFAGTLVHEGVHAFLHRYRRTLNISGWVGEGLANYIAEQVLGDDCLYGEQADLVAREYVRSQLPLEGLLQIKTPPQAHQYPLAHSLVAFLIDRDARAFTAFVGRIKDGLSAEEALRQSFDGMDYPQLQGAWREWVRQRQ